MGMMSKQDAPAKKFPCQLKFSTCNISQAFLACGSEHYLSSFWTSPWIHTT